MEKLILLIHILFASFWIGGMLFMALALSPYVKRLPKSTKIFQEVGKRYSFWGTIIGLPVLFITGILNSILIGGIKDISILYADIPYVNTLKIKLFLFFITTLIAVIHDFYFGPKAHLDMKYRKISRVLGVVNLIVGIIIIYLAVSLRLGG